MEAFLKKVVDSVLDKYPENQSNIVFVVAGNRVELFLRKYYALRCTKTMISPEFITIEDLVLKISGLKKMSNLSLLFELYRAYISLNKDKSDSFEVFISWGQILLQDFNEIDQYLINPDKIFPYIKAIKEVEHWSGADTLTDLQKKHLAFWDTLGEYYNVFQKNLLEQKLGYSGLIYREATKRISSYIGNNADKIHIFVGLNALSSSQEKMIQTILELLPSEIYWDTDQAFLDEPFHDAAMFIRSYINKWSYFKTHTPLWIERNFEKEKKISIIGVSKKENQAQKVAQLIRDKGEDFSEETTAVVLSDEKLLIPVINAIDTDKPINITMGCPLDELAISEVFSMFFRLYFFSSWYYKDLISFLTHPYVYCLFSPNTIDFVKKQIHKNNRVYIHRESLIGLFEKVSVKDAQVIKNILPDVSEGSATLLIDGAINYILYLKDVFTQRDSSHKILLEQAYRFYQLFNQLKDLQQRYNYLQTPKSLYVLYTNLLSKQTLDFKGEPLFGLQIMGVIESRNIDFENVILVSVNEGILPKGKSVSSFIPYDVKRYLGLPTYRQKDAIYAYYFYRLLQRAKNVYIIYNTDTDVLGSGEKSRFIAQLESFKQEKHTIVHCVETPVLKMDLPSEVTIYKTDDLCKKLDQLAEKGFSPSALANYIRNPLIFYQRNVLGIREEKQMEETIDARTFGDIIHSVLEKLYTQHIGQRLTTEHISQMRGKVRALVLEEFFKFFEKETEQTGRSFLMIEVFIEYINRFLRLEQQEIENGQQIQVLHLEKKIETFFTLKSSSKKIKLHGVIDRIDRRNGQIHIIDYKTGKVTPYDLSVSHWDNIIKETKYSKAFQLLTYAYMYSRNSPEDLPLRVGNYSFKNLSSGFLPFQLKDKQSGKLCNSVDADVIELYSEALEKLLIEIFNKSIPFKEEGLERS